MDDKTLMEDHARRMAEDPDYALMATGAAEAIESAGRAVAVSPNRSLIDSFFDDDQTPGAPPVVTHSEPLGPEPTKKDVDELESVLDTLVQSARAARDMRDMLKRFSGPCPFAIRAAAYSVARKAMEEIMGRASMSTCAGALGDLCEMEKTLGRMIYDGFASDENEETKITVRERTISAAPRMWGKFIDKERAIKVMENDPAMTFLVTKEVNAQRLASWLKSLPLDKKKNPIIPPELDGLLTYEITPGLSFVKSAKK